MRFAIAWLVAGILAVYVMPAKAQSVNGQVEAGAQVETPRPSLDAPVDDAVQAAETARPQADPIQPGNLDRADQAQQEAIERSERAVDTVTERAQRDLNQATDQLDVDARVRGEVDADVRAEHRRNREGRRDEGWRYRRHNDEWWHWHPGEYWVYWRDGRWHRYDRETYRMPRGYYGGRYTYDGGQPYRYRSYYRSPYTNYYRNENYGRRYDDGRRYYYDGRYYNGRGHYDGRGYYRYDNEQGRVGAGIGGAIGGAIGGREGADIGGAIGGAIGSGID